LQDTQIKAPAEGQATPVAGTPLLQLHADGSSALQAPPPRVKPVPQLAQIAAPLLVQAIPVAACPLLQEQEFAWQAIPDLVKPT
jgi:hypothetical protein